jgi:amino acid adenylation domain-containing protein
VTTSLHEAFEAQVDRAPERLALTFEGRALTYRELDERATRLARHLTRRGAGPGVMVGLCVPPSLDLVVAILAILKAGGAYVPLDPTYPRERWARIIDDARPRVVVTVGALASGLPSDLAVVRLDADEGAIAREPAQRLPPAAPGGLAYVLHTSGSTGRPKGVMVEHGSVLRLVHAVGACHPVLASDVWTLFHACTFDISVWEIWGALLHGGRLVVVPHTVTRSPEAFRALLLRERVTVLNHTPSAFRQLVGADAEAGGALLPLRLVLLAGEALEPSDLEPWWRRYGADAPRVVNLYGITETTVFVTAGVVSRPEGARSIGRPLPGFQVHLLDARLEPVPDGERGEIHVGGVGLSRGYLGRPDLTAERFVPDPFSAAPGARLYRSGDWARRGPSGDLEFLGRVDAQVKVRGHRVELGEIEATLGTHPAVARAVVLAREDHPGDRRLVAYVLPRSGAAPDPRAWRRHLEERLPGPLVPSAFVVLDRLPVGAHGKIDRGALPAPGAARPTLAGPFVAPRTPVEIALAGIWAEVLRVEAVGVDDDLFALGADSLLIARIASRTAAAVGVAVPPVLLFEATTVARLAPLVEQARRAGAPPPPPLTRAPRGGALPLSFAQRRLWFAHQLDPQGTAYTVPATVRLTGALDRAALGAGLEALVRRHEALRTTFVAVDGEPAQLVGPPGPVPVPFVDLGDLPEPGRSARLAEHIAGDRRNPFDLARGPLLRACLFRLGEAEHVLLLSTSHLACDGWSLGVLVEELAALHAAHAAGRATEQAALPFQCADHAAWQRAWLDGGVAEAQLAHWRRALDGARPLRLPTDRPRPPAPSARGAIVPLRVPAATSAAIRAAGREAGATPFMMLVAACYALLHAWTGEDDLVVGTPIAGRGLPELEGVVGFFANTLALRASLAGDPSFGEIVGRVRTAALGAYANQDVPFERVVEELRPVREAGCQPFFDVMFALQAPPPSAAAGDLRLTVTELDGGDAPMDLVWQLWESGDGLEGNVIFRADLFDPSTVARLVSGYEALLARVAVDPTLRLSALADLTDAERRAPAEAEAALLANPAIEECSARLRRGPGLTPWRIAYVVASRPLAADEIPAGIVAVHVVALPRAPDGQVDERALRALPVLDAEVVARAEAALRGEPGVTDAVVVRHEPRSAPARLHVAERMPDSAGAPTSVRRDAGAPSDLPPPVPDGRGAGSGGTPAGPLAFADGGPLGDWEGPRTLPEALARAAAGGKGLTYVERRGEAVFQSYAALAADARRVLAGLRAAGLRAGDRVILQLDALPDHFAAFWGALLGGITPVTVAAAPSYETRNAVLGKLAGAWALLGRPAIIAGRRLAAGLAGLGALYPMEGIRVLLLDDLRAHPAATEVHAPGPDDTAFLQLSSGSTGTPKCVQESHRAVLAHVRGVERFLGFTAADVSVNWLPLDHVVPMIAWHLKDLCLGASQIHVATELVLADPLLWLDLVEAHRVTHTWAPNFGFKRIVDAVLAHPERSWDLRSIKHFTNGGEQVTHAVARDFLRLLGPFGVGPRAIQPVFGMAETCTGITYQSDFDLETGVHRVLRSSLEGVLETGGDDASTTPFVDLGPPIPGVQLRIAGPDGGVLRERVVGRLQVRGAVVTRGYLDNPEANAESFVGDGWFDTGDRGFLAGGRLTLTGRDKEMIIVRGAKLHCHEVEDLVSGVAGVEPTFAAACAVGDPAAGTEGLAIFFVPRDGSIEARARLVTTLRREITARLGVAPAHVVPLSAAAFPKTTSGKIQRADLARALAEGRFREGLREVEAHLGGEGTVPDWFHRQVWRPRAAAARPLGAGASVVLLRRGGAGEALARALSAAGSRTILVEEGAGFAALGADRFAIDPAVPEQLDRVFDRLDGAPIARVVHLLTLGDPPADGGAVIDRAEAGAVGLLVLAQALARAAAGREARLLVVSSHAQPAAPGEPLALEKATVTGLIRSLAQEAPELDARHLDLEGGAPDDDARLILRELGVAERDREIAVRGGVRLAPRLERVDVAAAAPRPPPFVQGGAYLLAGGLGGIGVELATHLLTRHAARLLVIGRTVLADDPTGPRALAFEALSRAAPPGAALDYEAVDVGDAEALASAVARAEARWGSPLDGVVHLAGVAAERPLLEETAETLTATLHPRVRGAWSLQRLLEARPGAALVALSSVNATFGGFSAGAYAAANRFVELFVRHRRHAGHTASHCLAFTQWDDVGMSRGSPTAARAAARGYLPVTPAEGVRSMLAALAGDEAVTLIGLDASSRWVRRHLEGAAPAVHALTAFVVAGPAAAEGVRAVPDRLGVPAAVRVVRVERLPRTDGGEVDLDALLALGDGARGAATAHAPPEGEAEATIAAIWRRALRLERVGVNDNFFDLGGHSLMLAQVRAGLRDAFRRDVAVLELFRYPTVRSLAAYLGDRPAPARDASAEERGRAQRAALARRRPRAAAGRLTDG